MTDPRFAAAAREVKARGLILALEKFSAYRGSPVLARELLTFSETSWALLAMIADINPPSVKTRSLVVRKLCERDAAVLAANGGGR